MLGRRHGRSGFVSDYVYYGERFRSSSPAALFLLCIHRLRRTLLDCRRRRFGFVFFITESDLSSLPPTVWCCIEPLHYGERFVLVVTYRSCVHCISLLRRAVWHCRHRQPDFALNRFIAESDFRLPPPTVRFCIEPFLTTESVFCSSSPTSRSCIAFLYHGERLSFVG